MKTIISTTGLEIEFTLSGTRKITIGKVPVKVNELELRILNERLGNQITIIGEKSISEEILQPTVEIVKETPIEKIEEKTLEETSLESNEESEI